MNASNVVQTFYRRARQYDFDYADYGVDIPFNVQLAQELAKNGKVLEFACGTGRITFAIAKMGVNITGVDISPAMLDVAREKLVSLKAGGEITHDVLLFEGDMRNFDAGKGLYDYVFIPFTSFLHLTDRQSQQDALTNAYEHLVPGGYFLADIFMPDVVHLARDLGPNWLTQEKTVERDGRMLVRLSAVRYNQASQIIFGKWYYQLYETTGDGRQIDSYCVPMELRVIFPAEWELLLERAGFKIEQKWGGFNREPYDASSKRMLFLCKK